MAYRKIVTFCSPLPTKRDTR